MQPKAIIIDAPGAPEQLQWRAQEMPVPAVGECLLRQQAVGLNYIDIYHRSGLYPLPHYPAIIGLEGAGVIEAVGPDCQLGFEPGMPVAYVGGPVGAYAQYRTIPEKHLVRLPEVISPEQAACIMLKGLTAHYLLRRTFWVDANTTMLVHAAAGGVGSLLCQWGKHLGARVIGTVGSAAKKDKALAQGCDLVIDLSAEDVVAQVKWFTEGRGCNVVYDAIGGEMFMRSLDCLMPFGMMVSFGQASGVAPSLSVTELQKRGSLFLTRPSLEHYIRDHTEYMLATAAMFGLFADGILSLNAGQSYYLKDAAKAHADLEARRTTGTSLFYTEA